jgi:signal peptidase I
MMRLVGLPGETVFIKEGSLWINEVRVEPPAEMAGLHYTTEFDGEAPVKFGTAEEPLRLEPDQYFVLGDFSRIAADSRFWGPVPAANLDGVVSLCYWPVSRWRVFR